MDYVVVGKNARGQLIELYRATDEHHGTVICPHCDESFPTGGARRIAKIVASAFRAEGRVVQVLSGGQVCRVTPNPRRD